MRTFILIPTLCTLVSATAIMGQPNEGLMNQLDEGWETVTRAPRRSAFKSESPVQFEEQAARDFRLATERNAWRVELNGHAMSKKEAKKAKAQAAKDARREEEERIAALVRAEQAEKEKREAARREQMAAQRRQMEQAEKEAAAARAARRAEAERSEELARQERDIAWKAAAPERARKARHEHSMSREKENMDIQHFIKLGSRYPEYRWFAEEQARNLGPAAVEAEERQRLDGEYVYSTYMGAALSVIRSVKYVRFGTRFPFWNASPMKTIIHCVERVLGSGDEELVNRVNHAAASSVVKATFDDSPELDGQLYAFLESAELAVAAYIYGKEPKGRANQLASRYFPKLSAPADVDSKVWGEQLKKQAIASLQLARETDDMGPTWF